MKKNSIIIKKQLALGGGKEIFFFFFSQKKNVSKNERHFVNIWNNHFFTKFLCCLCPAEKMFLQLKSSLSWRVNAHSIAIEGRKFHMSYKLFFSIVFFSCLCEVVFFEDSAVSAPINTPFLIKYNHLFNHTGLVTQHYNFAFSLVYGSLDFFFKTSSFYKRLYFLLAMYSADWKVARTIRLYFGKVGGGIRRGAFTYFFLLKKWTCFSSKK